MLNLSAFVVMVCFSMLISACSEKTFDVVAQQKKKEPGKSMHSVPASQAGSGESAVTEAIKKQTLPDFPSMPIGKALEGYSHFTKLEWKETRTDSGKYYIDCIGWLDTKTMDVASLKNGVSLHGVAVKFVVTQDGSFGLVMVSKLEAKTDGNIYSDPLEDAKGILEKIYGNKEIRF